MVDGVATTGELGDESFGPWQLCESRSSVLAFSDSQHRAMVLLESTLSTPARFVRSAAPLNGRQKFRPSFRPACFFFFYLSATPYKVPFPAHRPTALLKNSQAKKRQAFC